MKNQKTDVTTVKANVKAVKQAGLKTFSRVRAGRGKM
jgi:hypothetical protein